MANPKKTDKIGFNIIGSDGYTSILSTIPMVMKCDVTSNDLTLYTKSKPTGVAIPHDTNWDASINSFPLEQQAIPGFTSNGDLEFTWKDFSTTKIDTYYEFNKGKLGIDYTISANWAVNDAVIVDDIAVVATKDWTSTEKIILNTPLTKSFQGHSVYTAKTIIWPRVYYPITSETITYYVFTGDWDSNITGGGDSEGNIVITYNFSGNVTTYTIVVPPGGTTGDYSFTATELNPTYVWEGTGDDPIPNGSGWPPTYTTYTGSGTTPIPPGAIATEDGLYYYFPDNEVEIYGPTSKTSSIIIPNTHFLFDQNSIGDKFKFGISKDEYFDYSDIFIEITYQDIPENLGASRNLVASDLLSTTYTKTYKFDGYVTYDEFTSVDNNLHADGLTYLKDDIDCTWKILIDSSTGYQFGVVLSGFLHWNPLSDDSSYVTNLNVPFGERFDKYFQAPLGEDEPEVFFSTAKLTDYKILSSFLIPNMASITVYKLVNFPNCGKIDIFTRAEGHIESIISNLTILSTKHGLKTLDRVKITGALSTDLYNKTNLNGIFYVNVITEDTFQVCVKKDLVPLTIQNYRTGTTQWTKVGSSNNWNYDSTIYSPNGKNGYSIRNPQLFKSYENPVISDDLNERAIVHIANYENDTIYGINANNTDPLKYNQLNYAPKNTLYPQGYFNGARSWNNFYPFERFENEDETALGVVNGNNFGQSVQLKKYKDNEYILMVTEPGALESYTALERYNNNKKFNKKVLPSYMPYGRIHFYKIVKTSSSFTINYLISASKGWLGTGFSFVSDVQDPSPWKRMETANFNSRGNLANPTQNGASYVYLNSENTYVENNTDFMTSYWVGALHTCWSKDFIYSSTLDIDVPNRNLNNYNLQDFYSADYFGKSADFEIITSNTGYDLYCITSTNVKSAIFRSSLGNRLKYTDGMCQYFKISNVDTSDQSAISNGSFAPPKYYNIGPIQPLVIASTVEQPEQQKQYKEYMDFGNTVILDNRKFITGWKSEYREYETLYYYTHTISSSTIDNYVSKQIIYSSGQNNFGNYIVLDKDMLLTNRYEYYDAGNNLLTNPIDTILTYRYDYSVDQFVYLSKITPTIDLSNSTYRNVNTTQYQLDANISYDNTTNNSASYIIDLDGRYDLYNGTLFLRDWNEISIFKFNDTLKKFVPKSHNFVEYQNEITDAQYIEPPESIIRVGSSDSAATFDSLNEFDFGQFSESIQLMDFSTKIIGTELNIISSIDSKDTTYLPLFLKTAEVSNSDLLPLLISSSSPSSGFLELFLEPIKGKTGTLDHFIKVIEPSSGSLDLSISPKWYNTGRINMIIAQKEANEVFELHTVSYNPSSIFPLFLNNPINSTGTQDLEQNGDPLGGTLIVPSISMYMESFHTGIPNGSTIMPLSIKTIPSLDHASPMPLSVNGNIQTSSGNINLYAYSAGSIGTSSGINLYLERSASGTPYDSSMYLFIDRPEAAQMNLFVYNIYDTGNMNLYTSGAYIAKNNMNLFCSSGVDLPTGDQRLFIKGSFTL